MLYSYVRAGTGLAQLPQDATLASACWIDLYRPLDSQVRQVTDLGTEVPTLEDMEEIEISNRLYREGQTDWMTAVLPGQLPDGTQVAMPVTFILSPERLVTVRHHAPRPFETFPTRAERGTAGCATPDRLFLSLIEEIIARLADLLEHAGRVIDEVAASVFGGPQEDARLRDALTRMGRQHEMMARVRLGLLSIERILGFYTANVEDSRDQSHLKGFAKGLNRDVQALEVHVDFLVNRVGMTMDATLGLISLQQNNTVRILSVVAALFLPPTLIASIYGMNFETMPELKWAWGYPLSLVAMAVSAAATFLLAKWRRWL